MFCTLTLELMLSAVCVLFSVAYGDQYSEELKKQSGLHNSTWHLQAHILMLYHKTPSENGSTGAASVPQLSCFHVVLATASAEW